MSEIASVEGRQPSTAEVRAYREQVREAHEALTFTEQRLQRGVVQENEKVALFLEWDAGNPEKLIRLIGWRAQALREEEERLIARVGGVFDPLACLDSLSAAIDGDEPPTRYQIRNELVYVVRELRRAGSPTRVW